MATTDDPATGERAVEGIAGPDGASGEAERPSSGTRPGGSPDRAPSTRSAASWRRRTILSLVGGALLAAGIGYVLASGHQPSSSSPPAVVSGGAGTPGISAADGRLLTLNVFTKGQRQQAPDFALTGRNGQPTTLAQFRGKVVIWSLNDDKCTNMCALFAQDIVAADRDLGAAARQVVFLAVNANPFFPTAATLQAWSVTNDLASLPNWVYVTGTPAQLRAAWSAYHVVVVPDTKTRTVTHDAVSYFIDPSGRMRAIADFTDGSISTAYYAHSMAQMADDLLPPSERVHVGGPSVGAPATAGATIGDRAPTFRLQTMATGHSVSLASLEGKPLVVNFWSSTCTICDQEMPTLQAITNTYASHLRVVGVDVADPRSAAAAFAAKVGAHYRLLDDQQGRVAAAYRVTSLPVTFLISAGGKIVARHPGALTATELAYILMSDFPRLPQITP